MMTDIFYPYWEINHPIWRKHKCKIHKLGYLINMEVLLKKFPRIYKILSRGYEIITNPRIVEIPLTIYTLGKYAKIGSKVLDIGCCESPLPIILVSLGFNVYTVDINEYELSELCANYNSFYFIKKDVTTLKFENDKFDVITAISTIEHIGIGETYGERYCESKDLQTLNLIKRWLKKDGIFIMSVPMENRYKIVPGFERHYDFNTIKKLLSDFKILEEYYIKRDKNNLWKIVNREDVEKTNDVFVVFVCKK